MLISDYNNAMYTLRLTCSKSQKWSSYDRVTPLRLPSLRSTSAALVSCEANFGVTVVSFRGKEGSSAALSAARLRRGILSGRGGSGLRQGVAFARFLLKRGQFWSWLSVQEGTRGRRSGTRVVDADGLEHLVGKVETQNSPRKFDEKVELGTREEVAATVVYKFIVGDAKNLRWKPSGNTGKAQNRLSGETELKKVAIRAGSSMSSKEGSEPAAFVIHLFSKGSAEVEYAEKLGSGSGLQLPDGAVVRTPAESTHGSEGEIFDVSEYLKNLRTSEYGRLVLYSSLIPSTHTLLSQNFHSFPNGTICIAGAQLQGKGRGGNVWQSPKGCLMFSFTTQMTDGRRVPFLQYIVSLAVIEAIEETCKAMEIPVPDVRIKWPNDLYADGLKIGGVLCTSTYRAKTFNIVVGVGLNVGNRDPTTCLDALIEDLHGGQVTIGQGQLLAAIMSKFEILNKIFQDQGFSPLQEEYCRKWLHTGQCVVLEEREAGSSIISHVPVTIQGLTSTGYLLALDHKGEPYELHPDGNSFDFMKGLVRQKLAV